MDYFLDTLNHSAKMPSKTVTGNRGSHFTWLLTSPEKSEDKYSKEIS